MSVVVAKGKKSVSTAIKGLKGVIAADSEVCFIDGQQGILSYRGYSIHGLAENSTFEEVAFLLLEGELPTRRQLDEFRATLASQRDVPAQVIAFLRTVPKDAVTMSVLRSAVSVAGLYDSQAEEHSPDANRTKAIRLIAQMGSIVAAFHRLRQGLEPVASRADLGHAANFLNQLNGRVPSEQETRAMDMILVLHAEHSFNASTFAGRVVGATLSDMYSAVVGAIGALKGPLHGGANTEVLNTLMEIGTVDNVEAWVEAQLAKKAKFMGFGHAVYQVEDPRAPHLKDLSRQLGEEKGETKWYEMSVKLEGLVKEAIQKNCNVDFYSASLQHYMGVPGDLFTCIFAVSRIAGWCAHILEQWSDNKIIRPSCNYTGSPDRAYVPIDRR
ncbi:MAG: citrate synthase [Planctomycetales bacterium]|nr:citrate synthase [Planctomycetales bacterium]